jgi:hypothetical protein
VVKGRDAMIQEFWNSYEQIKFEYFYYELYSNSDESFQTRVDIVSGVITLACIYGWSVRPEFSAIWSALILTSNVMSLVVDKFKSAQRVCALKYYLPEVSSLLNEMASKWREMQADVITDDVEILGLIHEFESLNTNLKNKYFSSVPFPPKEKLITAADIKTNQYLKNMHNSGVEKNE